MGRANVVRLRGGRAPRRVKRTWRRGNPWIAGPKREYVAPVTTDVVTPTPIIEVLKPEATGTVQVTTPVEETLPEVELEVTETPEEIQTPEVVEPEVAVEPEVTNSVAPKRRRKKTAKSKANKTEGSDE